MEQKIPNFFIVGAAKAGTSTLWEYLKHHPEIFMSQDELYKEPAFFSNLYGNNTDINKYFSLFNEANETTKRIGEASTVYLSDPTSAKRIYSYSKKYNIDVKIIILLRNPADRAYSLYKWNVQEGYEWSSNFNKALDNERRKEEKGIKTFNILGSRKINYQYFNCGLYSGLVNNYLDLFGEANTKIIIFEEFIKSPENILKSVLQFLNVDNTVDLKKISNTNPSFEVYSPKLQFLLRKITNNLIKFKLLKYNTKVERDRLLKLGIKKTPSKKMNYDLRKQLISEYSADIGKLEKILNKKLSTWQK